MVLLSRDSKRSEGKSSLLRRTTTRLRQFVSFGRPSHDKASDAERVQENFHRFQELVQARDAGERDAGHHLLSQHCNLQARFPGAHFQLETLQRIFVAKDLEERVAAEYLAEIQQWREENEVEAVYHRYFFPRQEAYLDLYPSGVHGIGNEGHPLVFHCPGALSWPKLQHIAPLGDIVRFHIQ